VAVCSITTKDSSDSEDEEEDEDGDQEDEEESDDDDKGSSAGSSDAEQDPSQLIDLISKRCSMALDTHNQFVVQLQKIARQQHENSDLAQDLNNTFERYYVEHASQERTVMLECICSDVDMMCRGIKDATVAMDMTGDAGASTFFSQAIAKGIPESSTYSSHSGSHNLAEAAHHNQRFQSNHSGGHEAEVDADRTVL